MKRIIATMICWAVCLATAFAQSKSEQLTYTGVEVHFRLDKHKLDLGYMGNKASFQHFAATIDSIGIERIDSVVIVSQSSPEGPYKHNLWLSEKRAQSMQRYLLQEHPYLEEKLSVHPDGESWAQLRNYVLADTKLKDSTKEKVLKVIDADVNIATKKWRMQQLSVYRYLLATYYPRIRNSVFCIVYYEDIAMPELLPVEPLETPQFREPERWQDTIITRKKTTIAAIKSNLFYDAIAAFNVEVEIPIGKRFSLMVEDVFPWYHIGNKYAYQMWEIGAEARYWFFRDSKRDKLSGCFVGPYLMSSKYDFQWDRAFNYQGEYWSGGLSLGAAAPIGKYFNLEFSIAFGYLSTAYRHYDPAPDYSELVRDPSIEGRLGYIGPTKLKASIVMPLQVPTKKRKEIRYGYR